MVEETQHTNLQKVFRDPRTVDHTGKVFGRLTVQSFHGYVKQGKRSRPAWVCRCVCGNQTTVTSPQLAKGKTRSCGCLQKNIISDIRTTHGKSRKPEFAGEYRVWSHMRRTPLNRNDAAYHNYGGRGICIDSRWDSFENFLTDMGKKPSPQHTLERVDNDRGYGPDNCVWASRKVQSRNRRNVRKVIFKGEERLVCELAEEYGVNSRTVRRRLDKGLTIEDALGIP